MRVLVTGIDEDGRSCAVSHDSLDVATAPNGFGFATVFAGDHPLEPGAAGHAEFHDLGLAPGALRWIVVEFPPGASTPHHCTDSYDFEVILSGTIDLTLDDGTHRLGAGDLVVMAAVDHTWTAGPDGCCISVCSLGTVPRDRLRPDA